ncbi:glycosyltransferase family 4 protein [Legionella shakespearei]|uniref:Glycosyl transferase, group 1 n=1 Tax=Legionella shakespearei DSM 23087 TaxID=1122169 RepID=A0A0W0YVQ7_9GAMM|nr:glycosyltransferase family 4 protein [Legionella shakespearei]KTD60734.1 glycosyl transferase, group 1 [Legionella shakespearei DSM 23087]
MKKKLIFVVNVDWFFISHRLPIAEAALQMGYEVHIAASLTSHAEALKAKGFIVHPLKIDRSSKNLFLNLKLLFDLAVLFRRVKPDIVHLVTIKPVLLGGIVARIQRVPAVVAAISGMGYVFIAQDRFAWFRRFIVTGLYGMSLKHPNFRIIVQNQNDWSLIKGVCKVQDKFVTLIRGSGVDLNLFVSTPIAHDVPPVVMMAARLLVDKGVREFAAAARALAGYHGARFILVGDVDPDNPSSLCRDEITAWVNKGIVEWWGHKSDMFNVLTSAHIVVLPSYSEGLPKVLAEAAATGRAVVTTDVPGCRDAIIPNETGLLVAPKDELSLTNAIKLLIDDKDLCEKFGAAGRNLAETTFDIKQVVNQHLTVYEELMP